MYVPPVGAACMVHDRRGGERMYFLDTCVEEAAWGRDAVASFVASRAGSFRELAAYCLRDDSGKINSTARPPYLCSAVVAGAGNVSVCLVNAFNTEGTCGVVSDPVPAAAPAAAPAQRTVSHVYVVHHAADAAAFNRDPPVDALLDAFFRTMSLKPIERSQLTMTMAAGADNTMRITATLVTKHVEAADFPTAFAFGDVTAVSDVLRTAGPEGGDDGDDDDAIIALAVAAGIVLVGAVAGYVYMLREKRQWGNGV